MQFADLTPGTVVESCDRPATSEESIQFATRCDPQWFQIEPDRAATGYWNGLIASGWLACAIALEMAVKSVLNGSESFGSPGVEQVKWLDPVRPGDILRLRIDVLQSRRSASGRTGVVRWQWRLDNHSGRPVLEMVVTSLFDISLEGGAVL